MTSPDQIQAQEEKGTSFVDRMSQNEDDLLFLCLKVDGFEETIGLKHAAILRTGHRPRDDRNFQQCRDYLFRDFIQQRAFLHARKEDRPVGAFPICSPLRINDSLTLVQPYRLIGESAEAEENPDYSRARFELWIKRQTSPVIEFTETDRDDRVIFTVKEVGNLVAGYFQRKHFA